VLCVVNHSTKVLSDTKKDDNSILKNNHDRWGISYLSEHTSYVKWWYLLTSVVKLILCGLSHFFFYKIGAIHTKQNLVDTISHEISNTI